VKAHQEEVFVLAIITLQIMHNNRIKVIIDFSKHLRQSRIAHHKNKVMQTIRFLRGSKMDWVVRVDPVKEVLPAGRWK